MRKKQKPNEPITENRRVIKLGSSYYLNLPPEFVRDNRIKPGTKVPVTCDHILKVIPHSEVK
jgi:hypothetical protein